MSRLARLGGVLFLTVVCAASADENRGTAEQAQAMVARAIAAFDARGEAAFAAMSPPSTEFRDRDLYIFVIGSDNRTVAHGLDTGQIGRDLAQMVDVTGKAFGQEMIDRADEDGVWVDYTWRDPLGGRQAQKTSWVVRHGGYLFGCGIYKP